MKYLSFILQLYIPIYSTRSPQRRGIYVTALRVAHFSHAEGPFRLGSPRSSPIGFQHLLLLACLLGVSSLYIVHRDATRGARHVRMKAVPTQHSHWKSDLEDEIAGNDDR